jgi:putative transposase
LKAASGKLMLLLSGRYLSYGLVRYIHLNPLRAGIVENLNGLLRYRWCGHRVLMGKADLQFQDSNYVLGYFGDTRRKAQEAYLSFMEAGIGQGERHDLIGGGLIRSYGGWQEIKSFHGEDRLKGDERILGDSAFVLCVLSDTEESHKLAGMDVDAVEQKIITLFDVSHDDLISGRGTLILLKHEVSSVTGRLPNWAYLQPPSPAILPCHNPV